MSQECQQPQAHSARRGCEEKKSYPDRLCHADYTAHPYHCGCLKGDAEAQRRFDEHQHHAAVPPAGGSLKCWNCKADFTLSERANCDGCCWKCGNEIDLDDYVTRLQAENAALQQRLNVADQRIDELEDAATVASMRIRELDLTFGRYLLGMKSAVIADESGGNGMEWIFNGLAGPGELPPEDEIDAQAYFDREVEAIDAGLAEVFAFHDARRKARLAKQ